MQEIELKDIDLYYESYRIKDKAREKYLLSSISEKGILEPVSGIINTEKNSFVMLDGFKRYRCAVKLNISLIPIESLSNDENHGILKLIRISKAKNLNTLEESILLNKVFKDSKYTKSEIARLLECSIAWVSVRLGIFEEMSETVKEALFSGKIPLRSYLYTLRSFTRVKGVEKEKIDRFIKQVSGKNLSTRDIEKLSYAYFNGSKEMEKEIQDGNISWILDKMKNVPTISNENQFDNKEERKMIHNLELFQKYMQLIIRDINMDNLKSNSYKENADLLIKGILSGFDFFIKTLREHNVRYESERNN